jgi:hypothetical protein
MCNLYSLTKGQAAIRDWFRATHDRTGNLPLFPGIFPDQMAASTSTATTDPMAHLLGMTRQSTSQSAEQKICPERGHWLVRGVGMVDHQPKRR